MLSVQLFKRALVILIVVVAAACGGETTPEASPEPVETDEPAAVELTPDVAVPVGEAAGDMLSYSVMDCAYGGGLAGVEALDTYTVRFTLCEPDPAFPSKVAFSALGIYPRHFLEATGGGGVALVQHPVGTGPYQLDYWSPGEEIVLTRFDEYWGEAGAEPTLIFRWDSDPAERFEQLQAGEVDGIDNPAPDDFDLIRDSEDMVLYERTGMNVFYIGLNNFFEPFDDVLVRRAIAHAIDRARIVDDYYPPGSTIATQFMPPMVFGYTPEVEPFQYDLGRARELLDEAGYPVDDDGIRFAVTLSYRNVPRPYLPQPQLVANVVATQLEMVGIDVELDEMESGAFVDAALAGELPMYLLGWNADYPDATNFLDYHFGGGAGDQFGEKHERLTTVLAEASTLADIQARYDLYVEANTLVRDLVPAVPVAYGGSGVAFRSVIEGGHASPLAVEYFGVMTDPDDDTFIWLQNGEPPGLYCADESDGEALRICRHINESLLAYETGGTALQPALAENWESNDALTEWTFYLREGVMFHDGSPFDANDVVVSFAAQWDLSHPLHVGRNGTFDYFKAFFGDFMDSQAP